MKPLRTTVAAATLAVLAALGTATPALADVPGAQALLQAGAQKGVADGYPAVVGLVRQGDTTQYASAGVKDLSSRTPADPKAQFRIGSNTKAFTSTVLLQLEAEGRLSLDDTVAKWLPSAVNANGYDGSKITIRELLNQTSGLPEYAGGNFGLQYALNTQPNQPWAPQALVDLALRQAPTAAPGQRFSYANTNYVLAGMVIKAVTGNEPATEIQQRIIAPLGLTNTTFPTSDSTLHGNYLHGYQYPGGLAYVILDETVSDVQAFGAAGAMVSTLDDLATFDRALLTGKLLPPAQEAELKTTVPVDSSGVGGYGLGIFHQQLPCGQWVWAHSGAVLGYLSNWYSSDDGSKQAVLANTEFHMVAAPPTRGQIDTTTAEANAYCAL
ncbi:serine hydrolase domain-containing protein [Kitasatospora sp. NPDC056138]|uniref:serine hydrolase domain-containing protein n=1 Tax=Kitasatospora sp. NPDC056138 TaxID=3345724 RepID=UPI0035D6E900